MGATQRSLQAQPKILKKLSEHKIYQSGRTFFQKKKRSQKFVWELSDGICTLNPKSKKKLSKYQIYQSERKFSQKKYVSYLKSVKEPKIRMGATRRNLQAQPEMLKKIVGTSNQVIRTKKFLRKLCFVA
jgi:hypothetical protein